jgi:hypothetical protein
LRSEAVNDREFAVIHALIIRPDENASVAPPRLGIHGNVAKPPYKFLCGKRMSSGNI